MKVNKRYFLRLCRIGITALPAFPSPFAEIETKLVQLKAAMQRQRQLAKEESMRRKTRKLCFTCRRILPYTQMRLSWRGCLYNIKKNAAFYSCPDSAIDIFAGNKGDKSVLVFQNEGKMIPKEKLALIFEKFFRLDEAKATNTGGTVHADSNERYTVFVMELPLW